MPRTRLIAVNPSSGVFTQILATIPAASVQIVEDGSVSPAQGLEIQFPADAYATTDTYPAGQPIQLNARPTGALGFPAQNAPGAFNYCPATTYCQVRSATATGTLVRVVESESE
ncbi:MAG: hypothetical protein ACRD2E_10570 [Terriglobales bacterium]